MTRAQEIRRRHTAATEIRRRRWKKLPAALRFGAAESLWGRLDGAIHKATSIHAHEAARARQRAVISIRILADVRREFAELAWGEQLLKLALRFVGALLPLGFHVEFSQAQSAVASATGYSCAVKATNWDLHQPRPGGI